MSISEVVRLYSAYKDSFPFINDVNKVSRSHLDTIRLCEDLINSKVQNNEQCANRIETTTALVSELTQSLKATAATLDGIDFSVSAPAPAFTY